MYAFSEILNSQTPVINHITPADILDNYLEFQELGHQLKISKSENSIIIDSSSLEFITKIHISGKNTIVLSKNPSIEGFHCYYTSFHKLLPQQIQEFSNNIKKP